MIRRAERNVSSSHTIYESWQFVMGVGNRKVQLLFSCCWAVTLLGARDQRSWGSWGNLSYSCSQCGLLQTGTKQEHEVPNNTCYKTNGILHTQLMWHCLWQWWSRWGVGGRSLLQSAIHSFSDSTGSIFTIATVPEGCIFNFQFKLHTIFILQGLEFLNNMVFLACFRIAEGISLQIF